MSNISRQGCHRVLDVGTLLVPELDAPTDERMSQIVDAGHGASAARNPAKVRTQPRENVLNSADWQGRANGGDEDECFRGHWRT